MKRTQEVEMESDDEGEGLSLEQLRPPTAKKMKTRAMDREFSAKEISKLKKVETMFHSSLFRMQVSELLKSVTPKQKLRLGIESVVSYLSKKLKKLPQGTEFKISDRSWLDTNKVQVPMIEVPKDVKGVFHFVPPTKVSVLGSVSLGVCVKPRIQVDLALLLPAEFLQGTDHMNQRYVRKKALYLAALASHMSKFKRVQNLNYAYHMGNPLRPILIATLAGEQSKNITVHLHVFPESHPFKLTRFHIAKNNVRPKWFFKTKSETPDKEDVASLPSTKYYNSSLLQDLCMVENEDYVKELVSSSEGLRHGIMLLKIWSHQRELSQGLSMFSNFLMTAYVAFLVKTKKVNKMMSSYQVFRTTLNFLSKADWQVEPPSLCDKDLSPNMPSMDEYQSTFDCVFIDRTGSYNMAYMLSDNVFRRVKCECQASLELLDQSEQMVFDALFMTAVPFARKFDHVFHVHIEKEYLRQACGDVNMRDRELDLGVNCRTLGVERQMLSVLIKALGKRAAVVQAKPIFMTKWHVSCKAFEYDRRSYLTFGVVLDPSEAYNVLNKGPPADTVEASGFHAFWGEKSEMRRFKDGSIHEAVLWSTSTNQNEKRIICKNIVSHVLSKHCGIKQGHIIYRGNPLDSLLQINPRSNTEIQSYGTGEEYSLAVVKAFEQVNRLLRAASDLPLSVTSVQGVHPVFRHADVFPPLPAGLSQNRNDRVKDDHHVPCNPNYFPPHISVLPVVCGFESSGKWPNDKDALDCMKTMLHIKMGQELKEKFGMCVGIHPTHLDLYKDGFVFRIKLACAREITVLRMHLTESGMLTFNDTEESRVLERDTVALPLHSHLIHSVQQQHPVFSATVRLCKRWLASQMVWDQIREEVIELIVASIFINPHPHTAPASPSVGFMRFLNVFSSFDWKNDILMVNLSKEFSEQDYSEIPQTFKNNRGTLPAMCIATPQDKQGIVWTKEKPEQLILERLMILARASLETLERQVMSFSNDCDFKQIFRPVLEHFDITITLRRSLNVLKHQGVDNNGSIFVHTLAEGQYTSKTALPVVDFDVYLKFVQDLKKIYGDLAYFFFDQFGGSVIGLVWKTQASEKKEFKASNFVMRQPVDDQSTVSLHVVKESIVEDISVLGSGLIEKITNHR